MNHLRVLRIAEVMARTGLSRSTIYARIAEGAFPCQIKLGLRAVGWSSAEVDAWIAKRLTRPLEQSH